MQTLAIARPLLHDDILDDIKDYDPIAAIAETFDKRQIENRHPLDIAQYTWIKTMLECQILNWGGDRVFDYNVLRTRTTYQISKTVALRAIVDYNHFYKQFYGSFLFSYILKPGTVFFFGVDNDFLRDDLGGYRAQAYSVFLKFSYWHRL